MSGFKEIARRRIKKVARAGALAGYVYFTTQAGVQVATDTSNISKDSTAIIQGYNQADKLNNVNSKIKLAEGDLSDYLNPVKAQGDLQKAIDDSIGQPDLQQQLQRVRSELTDTAIGMDSKIKDLTQLENQTDSAIANVNTNISNLFKSRDEEVRGGIFAGGRIVSLLSLGGIYVYGRLGRKKAA